MGLSRRGSSGRRAEDAETVEASRVGLLIKMVIFTDGQILKPPKQQIRDQRQCTRQYRDHASADESRNITGLKLKYKRGLLHNLRRGRAAAGRSRQIRWKKLHARTMA